jgi:hypothetical protein
MSSFLTDTGGQQWRIDVVESGGSAAYALTPVAGTGPTTILGADSITGAFYNLSIFLIAPGQPELELVPASIGTTTSIFMTAASGAVYELLIERGALAVALLTPPPPPPPPPPGSSVTGRRTWANPGIGSRLFMSADGVKWQPVAQLKSIIPTGSKQTIVDQTNLLTSDNFSRPLAVRIDSGEIELDGVLDPQNADILQLGTAHASLTVQSFKLVFPEGTEWDFQALVSEFIPFTVKYSKYIGFSAKLRVSGALNGPAGAV